MLENKHQQFNDATSFQTYLPGIAVKKLVIASKGKALQQAIKEHVKKQASTIQ
jgi:hypothetical protein